MAENPFNPKLEYTLGNKDKKHTLEKEFHLITLALKILMHQRRLAWRSYLQCIFIGFENAMKYLRVFNYHIVVNCASFMANISKDVIAWKINEPMMKVSAENMKFDHLLFPVSEHLRLIRNVTFQKIVHRVESISISMGLRLRLCTVYMQ